MLRAIWGRRLLGIADPPAPDVREVETGDPRLRRWSVAGDPDRVPQHLVGVDIGDGHPARPRLRCVWVEAEYPPAAGRWEVRAWYA
jgi:hypothetical protein